ncbi:MAG TPA: hypothetical protein VFQ49_03815, partial [Actinomycetes bacterium]|nr:hypothetical protein [Actinomycetes bacterium]
MSMTIRRGRPPARPAAARPAPGMATLLAAYLAAAFLVLAVVLAVAPHRAPAPPAPTWDYQRERVALEGGGALNAYARWAVGTTAALTRGSIERQRDVHRLSPLDFHAGEPAARGLSAWRERHRLPLEGATLAAVCALAAWGTLRRRPGRAWLAALLLLVGLTVLVTHPRTATTLAARAGTAIPNLVLSTAATADPSGSVATAGRGGGSGVGAERGDPAAGGPGVEAVQRTVAERYWTAFVGEPLSRLQTGTTVLATAPPAAKPGVLGSLRSRVTAVGDWAVGRHGPERAVIASLALAYVLPFALALVALAMLASCAQTLVWLLALAGPVVLPLAVDPRRRRAVLRWWLVPLAAALALLAGAAQAAQVVIRVAELTHAADAYLGMLLAGSTAPLLAAFLALRHLRPRRPSRPRALPSPRPAQPTRRSRPPKPATARGGA